MRSKTTPRIVVSSLIGLATFSVAVLPAHVAAAATDTVTNCNGSGAGSLPVVVASAASGDAITFSVACPPASPIVLNSTIDITQDLVIDGPGASSLVVSGNRAVEAFNVPSGVVATISGIAIENCGAIVYNPPGNPVATVYEGGGISNDGTLNLADSNLSENIANSGADVYNGPGATLHLTDSFLSHSSAVGGGGGVSNGGTATINDSTVSNEDTRGVGGGIGNGGTLTITNSTLSDNGATASGGIFNSGTLTISDSTLSSNGSDFGFGGIDNNSGTLTISDSTLWQNGPGSIGNVSGHVTVAGTIVADSTPGKDCFGSITDAGFNLDDDGSCGFGGTSLSDTPAGLDPTGLHDNGGPTQTIALESGSAANGAVQSATLCSTPDQLGVARPTPCDIGAVELVIPQAITSPNHVAVSLGSPLSFTVTTSGWPVPSLTVKGELPKHVTFTDHGDGTGTIAGKPTKAETYRLTIMATFGKGATRYRVIQRFTLTVST